MKGRKVRWGIARDVGEKAMTDGKGEVHRKSRKTRGERGGRAGRHYKKSESGYEEKSNNEEKRRSGLV